MLILNRKIEEEIHIETPEGFIILKVVDIEGKTVKIGIDAPKKYPIFRKELLDMLDMENKESVFKKNFSDIPKIFGIDKHED